MAKRKSQTDHDNMVKSLADHLIAHNYSNVKAAINGYDYPSKITWRSTGQGHFPDATARDTQSQIFEVETEDSINDSHTEDQWKLFAAHANNTGGVFTVVVPHGCSQAAQVRLNQLNLRAKVWEA